MSDHEAVDPDGAAASLRSGPTVIDAALVGLGAGIGACLRHLVETTVVGRWESLAVVNLLGSLLLGLLAGVLTRPTGAGRRWLSPLVATGLLGGFTTFSTVAVAAWGSVWGIAGFAAMTLGCVGAAGVGHLLGRRVAR